MIKLKYFIRNYRGFRKALFTRKDAYKRVKYMWTLAVDLAKYSKENGLDDIENLKKGLREYYR